MHARRPLAAGAATALVLALALAGCGSDEKNPGPAPDKAATATPAPQVSEAPDPEAKVIAIRLKGETVEPSGERIDVTRNQPVVLQINADRAGELHVHSTPEQHLEFPKGGSEITLVLDQPGVVDIEEHELDKLIVQLEVR